MPGVDHYTADSAAARANRAVLEEHLRREIAGDLEGTLATMVDEPYLMPGTGLVARGRESVAAVYATRFRDVPDQHFEVVRSIVTDDMAVIEGYVNATPRGTFFGLPAHGKRVRLRATVWIEFADGKLAGERGYYDTAELRRQLEEGAPD
ncbi:MAG TPA: ester cyclase [Chloroflexota bacterium]|nr:ester cyclase [Chloroflexota bacterium]